MLPRIRVRVRVAVTVRVAVSARARVRDRVKKNESISRGATLYLFSVIRDRFRYFVVTGAHKGVLCVRQHCGRRRQRSCIWAVAGWQGVQHAHGDDG